MANLERRRRGRRPKPPRGGRTATMTALTFGRVRCSLCRKKDVVKRAEDGRTDVHTTRLALEKVKSACCGQRLELDLEIIDGRN